jgi:arylformamidase
MTPPPSNAAPSGPVYRGMNRPELDAAYNNSAAVEGSAKIVESWRRQSGRVRARDDAWLDIRYGDRERMMLDYFPCGEHGAPLFAFIHGGYWQRNDKDGFSVFALGPLTRQIDVATIGYTLAPQACLREIVAEISQAIDHLAAHADSYGFDKSRLYVGGWSAGGHLAAMMLGHPGVRACLPISGIFELEPISLNYLNDPLSLTAEEISDLSPIRLVNGRSAPASVVVGGDELPELRRQSEDYAAAARKAGMDVSLRHAEGRNHFTMLEELIEPDGGLTRDLVALIGRTAIR